MVQPNVSYFHNNSFMNTHKNNIARNENILQGEKGGILLFMNNVHIIMYNISISYLNGLII